MMRPDSSNFLMKLLWNDYPLAAAATLPCGGNAPFPPIREFDDVRIAITYLFDRDHDSSLPQNAAPVARICANICASICSGF